MSCNVNPISSKRGRADSWLKHFHSKIRASSGKIESKKWSWSSSSTKRHKYCCEERKWIAQSLTVSIMIRKVLSSQQWEEGRYPSLHRSVEFYSQIYAEMSAICLWSQAGTITLGGCLSVTVERLVTQSVCNKHRTYVNVGNMNFTAHGFMHRTVVITPFVVVVCTSSAHYAY